MDHPSLYNHRPFSGVRGGIPMDHVSVTVWPQVFEACLGWITPAAAITWMRGKRSRRKGGGRTKK